LFQLLTFINWWEVYSFSLYQMQNLRNMTKQNAKPVHNDNNVRYSMISTWTTLYSPFNLNLPMQYDWLELKTLLKEFKELQYNIHEESTMKFPTCPSHLTLILYSLQWGHAYNFKTFFALFGLTNHFRQFLSHFS